MPAADYAASQKEPPVKKPRRLVILPAMFLASAGFAACGDDAVQKPADTEMMTESTEKMMTDTTDAMMTESTDAMMTDTTGG